MNKTVNKVTLIGYLGNDPKVHTFESGNKKCSFSLATNDGYTNKKGEKIEHTEWHNIVAEYNQLATLCEKYLHKGDKVYLEGKIQTRDWVDKEGAKHYVCEIIIREFMILTPKGTDKPSSDSESSNNNLPF